MLVILYISAGKSIHPDIRTRVYPFRDILGIIKVFDGLSREIVYTWKLASTIYKSGLKVSNTLGSIVI